MKIEIIGSGSSGNSILFGGSVLLDTGVPYKHIEKHAKNIRFVLLTHIHGDHFDLSVIRKLYIENNGILFIAGEFLYKELIYSGLPAESIVIISSGEVLAFGEIKIAAFDLYHDVDNFGYRIVFGDHRHIHATDTQHLEGISALNYDSATIECNHHREAASAIIEQYSFEDRFCHLVRTVNTHLSVDKAVDFIVRNKIKHFYPCHLGSSTKSEVINYIKESGLEKKGVVYYL